ncbi:hypothetical protein KC901_02535 [Patescibacteria group bacterium]|nr:hypothetical protein [Patescibacteria group bacterium]
MNHLEQFAQLPYSHHAYGIESSHNVIEQLKNIIPINDCSYIFDKEYDTFKIDDARAIKSLQSEKTEKAAIFILRWTLINTEAQNALLKVLEEPTPNTYFILLFPNAKMLLPTLQSRLSMLYHQEGEHDDTRERKIILSSFLTMSLQERFDIIKQLTDKKSENTLTKADVLLFLNDLERYLHEQKNIDSETMGTVFEARNYLEAKGASMKMILDTIAMHL